MQVYRAWAELWAAEAGGHMVRVSMNAHIFLLPMDLGGDAAPGAVGAVPLRMCWLALQLQALLDTALADAPAPVAYRCAKRC